MLGLQVIKLFSMRDLQLLNKSSILIGVFKHSTCGPPCTRLRCVWGGREVSEDHGVQILKPGADYFGAVNMNHTNLMVDFRCNMKNCQE